MDKIVYDGETFYVDKGKILDSSFIEVPKGVALDVSQFYFKQIDYTALDEENFLKHIKSLKNAELYSACVEAITFGLGKFSTSANYYRTVFPIITSCYRAMGTPQKAIDFWLENKAIFRGCISTPLLTSLAAAYCDVGDYVSAKKCADYAYALQGGGQGYKNELSLVYRRIQKESGR